MDGGNFSGGTDEPGYESEAYGKCAESGSGREKRYSGHIPAGKSIQYAGKSDEPEGADPDE